MCTKSVVDPPQRFSQRIQWERAVFASKTGQQQLIRGEAHQWLKTITRRFWHQDQPNHTT
jgi:hypothetical protein